MPSSLTAGGASERKVGEHQLRELDAAAAEGHLRSSEIKKEIEFIKRERK